MKNYCLKIYGCAMNYADSQAVAGWYNQKGWLEVKTPQLADEVVIISCSVRESAENRVYGLVNNLSKLKIKNCKLKIVLTGCMLRYPTRLLTEKMPNVDEFKKISFYAGGAKKRDADVSKPALVPIMEGCNNFCSYCVVPYARGREISRDFEEIVCEVEELANRGFKEIVLLGQNVNSYQHDFAKLLTRLHQIEKLQKISFLTSNPWDLTDEIIQAMKLPKVDRYLHLAVQSGDDQILKKMNRKYQVKDFLVLVNKLRQAIPDIQIGTDIIVGFPGETKEQFENTLSLCQKVGFAKAYVSMYSPRSQTVAFKMKDDIPHKEKRRRWLILDQLINKK